jgi:hypothetical protein
MPAKERKPSTVWRLTVRLTGIMPIIWRAILDPIRSSRCCTGISRPPWVGTNGIFTPFASGLKSTAFHIAMPIENIFDFGDRWQHTIELEGAEAAEYRKHYPICADGLRRARPKMLALHRATGSSLRPT